MLQSHRRFGGRIKVCRPNNWPLLDCAPLPVLPRPGRSASTNSCCCWASRHDPAFSPGANSLSGASLSRDTLERLSNLLGIYKSLQILLPDPAAADAWVRQPNTAPPFGGSSALARMLAGNVSDLNQVRRYLDSVRGGGWS